MPDWSLYLIRCRDGKLYTGISTDVPERVERHGGRGGAKFTRGKGPFDLAFCHLVGSRSLASRLEYRVKSLRKIDKERLVQGDLALGDLLSGEED